MTKRQGSPQDNLSGGYTLAKVLSKCFKHRFQHFFTSVSGGKTSLSGGKITEWWLEPITPDQCGENPEMHMAYI